MSTLKPGRETDARVAEVLGWRLARPCYGFPPNCEGMKHPVVYPRYSTSPADAIAALEATGERYTHKKLDESRHAVAIHQKGLFDEWHEAPTLPLAAAVAICKWGESK